jgi:hypothetical protein
MKHLLLLIICLTQFAFSPPEKLSVSVETVFNNEPLQLNGKRYVNAAGDTLTIETFRFYISNFHVYSKGKKREIKNSYFLIDAEKENSWSFELNVPGGKIDSLSFIIGVDSLANVSGAMEGALDPMNGMYWAWNTGYIHAKLEGKSNSCKTLHHLFEFHIGGYLRPYQAVRKVCLPLDGSKHLKLKADVAAWFNGVKKIDLKETNSVMMPCSNAMMVADNYQKMFSLIK